MKDIINQFVVDPRFIFQSLANNSNDYIYIWDMRYGSYMTSENMAEDFHIEKVGSDFGQVWSSFIHRRDVDRIKESFHDILNEKRTKFNLEYQVLNAQGTYMWVSDKAMIQYQDEKNEPILVVGILHNLSLDGEVDAVTGLLMHDKCQKVYEYKQSINPNFKGSIMLLGMDEFSNINTMHDHSFGDLILREIVQKVYALLDESSRMYRFDGDQILIVCDDKNVEDTHLLYNRIKKHISGTHELQGITYQLTASAGIILFPIAGYDWYDLEKALSIALKKAKELGKNQCVMYKKEMLDEKLYEHELTKAMSYSIGHGFKGFKVVYQPVCYAPTLKVKGAEALLRFVTEDNKTISPIEFIPLLEQSQMIHSVGLWVLEEAIKTCKKWIQYIKDFTMNVNVSYIQLRDSEFCEHIEQLFEKYDLDMRHLTVELTESYFITDAPNIKKSLMRMEALPLQIAMDDFGTGYSSLARLSQFNVDVVKIDRSFIQSVHTRKYNYDFVDSVIRLCHNVGMKVCVEGVETKEEQKIICLLDADYIQGFYVSRPIDEKVFLNNFLLMPNANDKLIVSPDMAFQHNQVITDRDVLLAMMDACPLALNFWNRNYEIIACNKEVLNLFGANDFSDFKENFYTFSPLYQPDGLKSVDKAAKCIDRVLEEERLTMNWMHINREGMEIPVEVTLVRIPYRNEYIVASYTRDLRSQYAMEERNKKFNQRLKAILDATPLCLNLWNEKFENTMCNKEAVELFGLSSEADYTANFFKLSPPYQADGLPSNEKAISKIKEAIQNGRTQFKWMHRNLKNEEIPTEITLVRIDEMSEQGESLVAGYTRDIRKQLESEKIQQNANERIRGVLDSMPLACILWTLDKKVIDCNDFAVHVLGAKDKKDLIQNFDEFNPLQQPDGTNSFEKKNKKFEEALKKGRCNFEWVYQNRNGEDVPCEVTLVKVVLEQEEIIVAYSRDLRELYQTLEVNDRLSKLAYYDLLTGCASRAKFMEKLEENFTNVNGQEILSLIIFDVDYFKKVNDTYGHGCGDMILKHVVKLIGTMLPENAMLGRYGGDEFIIQIVGMDNNAVSSLMKTCVYKISQQAFHYEKNVLFVTISIGVAFKKERDHSYRTLIKRADKALYEAKEKGRNCLVTCK